jgi:hypothetical protein
MQRFYFDLNDGKSREVDTTGQELSSPEEARRLAVQELSYMIRDEMHDGEHLSYVVTVRDDDGTPIYVAVAQMLGEHLL